MRMIDYFSLPIKTVSDEEKRHLETLLRESNRVLEIHHDRAKKNGFSSCRRAFFSRLCKGQESHDIPEDELRLIVRAKELEWDFLAIYSRMILKISGSWFRRLDKSVGKEDICAAATEGFLKAFCCFTEEGRFSTYLTICLNRHIASFVSSHGNQLSVPVEIMRLRSKARKLMREEGLSLDSAVGKMGVNEKTGKMIAFSMSERAGSSEFVASSRDHESDIGTSEMLSVVAEGLEGLERAVFEEFLALGENMNLSEISRRTLNPKTGKPYSRMALCLAWRRVRDRISCYYGRVA